MLECVINVSEGRRADVVAALAGAAGAALLDVHTDPDHHRSVLTLGGPADAVEAAARAVATAAVSLIDVTTHVGVHPRLGAVDVVPFVPLAATAFAAAVEARDRFALWAAGELTLPCFLYGPERPLPEVRRRAFRDLRPDVGPGAPHPSAGACAVGARGVLVAYNVWLAPGSSLSLARSVAGELRGPFLRTLGLAVGGGSSVQVSMNLVDPLTFGPAAAYDAVATRAEVARAELVGLVPAAVLDAVPRRRWASLDLDPSRTIEARLEQAGLDGGSFSLGSTGSA